MLKYIKEDTLVTFSEIPDEISLCLNISNCQNNCKGCHSPYLRKNIGVELNFDEIDKLIKANNGITCVCFMGEGKNILDVLHLAGYIKNEYGLKTALYSGRTDVPEDSAWHILNYIKIGPYIKEFGPLNKETTNQRLYKNDGRGKVIVGEKIRNGWIDITNKFW